MVQTIFRGHWPGQRSKHRFLRLDRFDMRTLCTLNQHLYGTVRQLQHLQDIGDTTDGVKILGFRIILCGRLLGNQQNAFASLHRHFQRLDRLRSPDKQRNHHVRENNHIAQRQQRQFDSFSRRQVGIRRIRRHRWCPIGKRSSPEMGA